MSPSFRCGRFELRLERPLVMGIVNVTPDSFSDGAEFLDPDVAVAHARQLVAEGADILDIGGESTRPGAQPVDANAELARVLPVVEALRDVGVPLSVDTSKADVMRRVLVAGADMINDVYALRQPGALEAVAGSDCGVCIMHMQGEPRSMQVAPQYDDLLADVQAFLQTRVEVVFAAGIDPSRVVTDPGFGFGKTKKQDFSLLQGLAQTRVQALPMLLGLSRKSMIGHVTGRPVRERLAGSIAGMLAGVARGAQIVRVHDVAATVDALKVWRAVEFGVTE
ncbi:MAG TPA: dihydropteroate synthase [Burkholderiaceae bacterium]|nr:dihydropteroate synthase [Burkholderiaceae bacterium]